jgi:hypothetical protein
MGKISAMTALTGANAATGDLVPVVDVSATTSGSKTMTLPEFFAAVPVVITTEMTGSGAAGTDEYAFFDGGVPKTITVVESVAAQFAGVSTSMLGSEVTAATDEIMASDAGVPKTMTFDELFSALALNGFATLADIAGPHADQAAAATAITGTGKIWYQTGTGLLGITLT